MKNTELWKEIHKLERGEKSRAIRRCPVEGCGRPLKRGNVCPRHGHQMDFVYDLKQKRGGEFYRWCRHINSNLVCRMGRRKR